MKIIGYVKSVCRWSFCLITVIFLPILFAVYCLQVLSNEKEKLQVYVLDKPRDALYFVDLFFDGIGDFFRSKK